MGSISFQVRLDESPSKSGATHHHQQSLIPNFVGINHIKNVFSFQSIMNKRGAFITRKLDFYQVWTYTVVRVQITSKTQIFVRF